MARKVDVVRPRALRDVIVLPTAHRPSRGSARALGLALLVTTIAVSFALGFLAARLVHR